VQHPDLTTSESTSRAGIAFVPVVNSLIAHLPRVRETVQASERPWRLTASSAAGTPANIGVPIFMGSHDRAGGQARAMREAARDLGGRLGATRLRGPLPTALDNGQRSPRNLLRTRHSAAGSRGARDAFHRILTPAQ
jgi:hypothetical protein